MKRYLMADSVLVMGTLQSWGNLRLHAAFEGSFVDTGPSNMTLTASGNAGIESRLSRTILGAGSLLLDGKDNSFLALSNAVVFANGTP